MAPQYDTFETAIDLLNKPLKNKGKSKAMRWPRPELVCCATPPPPPPEKRDTLRYYQGTLHTKIIWTQGRINRKIIFTKR